MNEFEKTVQLAHYIIARTNPSELGATKLNKVLWFLDVEYYRKHGRTLTGAKSYIKRQYGPVPNYILKATSKLESDGKIKIRMVPTPKGDRKEYIWLEEPLLSHYESVEIDLVHKVISWVTKEHTANSISDLTHDKLWEETEIGGDISVAAAAVVPGEITEDIMNWALAVD